MTVDARPIGESKLWNRICRRVYGPRQGGAKVVIDAEDAELGAGKTSAAVYLARIFAKGFGYDLKKADMTHSAQVYQRRAKEQPGKEQPSVLVLDEAVGGGAGDARRAMSGTNVDMARCWELIRKRRIVTFVTLAHWGNLDKRLRELANYRLYCRTDPIGNFRSYKIRVDFDDGGVRTKTLDSQIHFPNMMDDPYYQAIEADKDEILRADTWDADDLQENGEDKEEEVDEFDPKAIAEDITSNGIEDYIKKNSSNGVEYISGDLIEVDYDLSRREAKKVKALVEREKENMVAAQ